MHVLILSELKWVSNEVISIFMLNPPVGQTKQKEKEREASGEDLNFNFVTVIE